MGVRRVFDFGGIKSKEQRCSARCQSLPFERKALTAGADLKKIWFLRHNRPQTAYNFPRLEVRDCMKKGLYVVFSLLVVALLSAFFLPERAGEVSTDKRFFASMPSLFYMENDDDELEEERQIKVYLNEEERILAAKELIRITSKISKNEGIIIAGDFNKGINKIGKHKYVFEEQETYPEYEILKKKFNHIGN